MPEGEGQALWEARQHATQVRKAVRSLRVAVAMRPGDHRPCRRDKVRHCLLSGL